MCARRAMSRPAGDMSEDLFRSIVDEIADKQPHCYVHWYGIGEPLLAPGLFGKLAYAYSRGLHNTVLFTNGQLLLENENFARLAESGVRHRGRRPGRVQPGGLRPHPGRRRRGRLQGGHREVPRLRPGQQASARAWNWPITCTRESTKARSSRSWPGAQPTASNTSS